MSFKEVFTFRTLSATFVAANGIVTYSNINKLKRSRPEFKDVAPPEERHRIAIFDNVAPTYDLTYNAIHSKLGITAAKENMLKRAKGHVLEVAAGTLENYKLYGDIDSLTAVDRSLGMCLEMKRKVDSVKPKFPVTIICGDASALPFEDESFNTVVSTHGMCSVEKPHDYLLEIARVMRPSARFFALERGVVYYRPLRRILEWMKIYPNPNIPWKHGYFENRDPLELLRNCKNLKVTDFAVFGYGMNYTIVSRRVDCDKMSELSDEPRIRNTARIVHKYDPLWE